MKQRRKLQRHRARAVELKNRRPREKPPLAGPEHAAATKIWSEMADGTGRRHRNASRESRRRRNVSRGTKSLVLVLGVLLSGRLGLGSLGRGLRGLSCGLCLLALLAALCLLSLFALALLAGLLLLWCSFGGSGGGRSL